MLPSAGGVDSSRDCSHVDCVLVETLIIQLLVSVLTLIANEIAPSGLALIVHGIVAVWIMS